MIGDRDKDALENILYCIDLLKKYSEGLEEKEFYQDQAKQDLIVHRLEIIGEATRRLSNDIKEEYNDIPWQDMKDMRNILIHQKLTYYSMIIKKILKKQWEMICNGMSCLKRRPAE